MIRELRRPTPETLMLQRELEKTKESLRQELTLSEANKQQLEKRLQEEVGICCVREREDKGNPPSGADVI